MNVFNFMSQNPVLTFFLVVVGVGGVVSVIRAIRGVSDCDDTDCAKHHKKD